MRVNYQTTTPCEVKITTYQLPEEAYCIFADQRILTPAGLVVDHLRHPNAMQAIANAEEVIRGHLHPDAREQAATLQRFTEFIADVRKIATQLASRYRNKVLVPFNVSNYPGLRSNLTHSRNIKPNIQLSPQAETPPQAPEHKRNPRSPERVTEGFSRT